jgi:glycosyltransferase involved in cell wall biosynthesis
MEDNMTKVAMLVPTIDQIGGAEKQVLLLAKELADRGWQVTVIALSGTGVDSAQELQTVGIKYLSLQMRKAWIDPRGWLRYLAWVSRNRPAIVHAHLPHATWFARCARLLAPVRVVVDTIHTSNPGGKARQLAYRLTHRLTNRVTAVSASVASAAIAAKIAPEKSVTVLFNGVEFNGAKFNGMETSKPNTSVQPFRWIAVGRLAPVKDYPTLLRAFATLTCATDAPNLQIVGSGPEEHTLRNLARELEIEDRVQFAGFHRDVKPFLTEADAFVLSSLWEGLPIAVLEAAAAGLPVVATDGNGTREAMRPNETGRIVPVGDVAALAQAMAQVMAIPLEQRLKMGETGREFVEKHFSLCAIVDQWESLYRRLLEENPHPSRQAGRR